MSWPEQKDTNKQENKKIHTQQCMVTGNSFKQHYICKSAFTCILVSRHIVALTGVFLLTADSYYQQCYYTLSKISLSICKHSKAFLALFCLFIYHHCQGTQRNILFSSHILIPVISKSALQRNTDLPR